MRYYQVDLCDFVWIKQVSLRKFVVMIAGLPADSAWQRFVQNKDEYALPLLID